MELLLSCTQSIWPCCHVMIYFNNIHCNIDGLAQGCGNSCTLAMALPESCAKPSVCGYAIMWKHILTMLMAYHKTAVTAFYALACVWYMWDYVYVCVILVIDNRGGKFLIVAFYPNHKLIGAYIPGCIFNNPNNILQFIFSIEFHPKFDGKVIYCNSTADSKIGTKFCSCHNSTTVMPCAKFFSDYNLNGNKINFSLYGNYDGKNVCEVSI